MRFRLSLIVVVCLLSVFALAQSPHHLKLAVVHPAWSGVGVQNQAAATKLFQLSFGMGALPPLDEGGADEWPCFGGGTDCSTIAPGGVVIGTPAYTWSLAACDGNNPNATACGQIFWFYEDDTGDNTDDLIVSLIVKQGTHFILDTGKFDFGPNPFPAGSIIIIYDDTAFGTLGQTGKNNGFCAGSNKVCVDPVAGPASVALTTQIGSQKISAKFNINLQ